MSTPTMLTLRTAQAEARAIGMTIKRDHDWGEYLVYATGTPRPKDHPATYFTSDLTDALDTAVAMAKKPDGAQP